MTDICLPTKTGAAKVDTRLPKTGAAKADTHPPKSAAAKALTHLPETAATKIRGKIAVKKTTKLKLKENKAGQNQKNLSVVSYNPFLDIFILREVVADSPFDNPKRYNEIAKNVNAVLAEQTLDGGDPPACTARSVKGRIERLIQAFKKEEMDKLKSSGTAEEVEERCELLQDIVDKQAEAENVSDSESYTVDDNSGNDDSDGEGPPVLREGAKPAQKTKKDNEKSKKVGDTIRNAAMKRMGSGEDEFEAPKKRVKKEDKYFSLREKELEFKQQQLDFERKKFEMEKEERMAMMNLLGKVVGGVQKDN